MASSHFLTKATKLLLRSNTRIPPSRPFHVSTPTSNVHIDDGDASAREICDIEDDKSERHPFQESGPTSSYAVKHVNVGLYMIWLDMPGVGKKNLNVWMENDSVVFECKAPKESEHDGDYSGEFNFKSPWLYNKEELRAEVENGVVKITMPRQLKIRM